MQPVRLAVLFALAVGSTTIANPHEIERRAQCNADNCARQVSGTATLPSQPARTVRASDCSSFLATIVVPAPIVRTTTVTIIAGQATASQSVVTTAQTKVPSEVPTYISKCGISPTLSSRYRSACACFSGVTSTLTTVPTPTSTTTIYASCSTAILQASSGTFAGQYFVYPSGGPFTHGAIQDAQRLVYRDGMFYEAGSDVNVMSGVRYGDNYIYLGNDLPSVFNALVCTIAVDGSVSCHASSNPDANVFFTATSFRGNTLAANYFFFGTPGESAYAQDPVEFVPKAIPVCVA